MGKRQKRGERSGWTQRTAKLRMLSRNLNRTRSWAILGLILLVVGGLVLVHSVVAYFIFERPLLRVGTIAGVLTAVGYIILQAAKMSMRKARQSYTGT